MGEAAILHAAKDPSAPNKAPTLAAPRTILSISEFVAVSSVCFPENSVESPSAPVQSDSLQPEASPPAQVEAPPRHYDLRYGKRQTPYSTFDRSHLSHHMACELDESPILSSYRPLHLTRARISRQLVAQRMCRSINCAMTTTFCPW